MNCSQFSRSAARQSQRACGANKHAATTSLTENLENLFHDRSSTSSRQRFSTMPQTANMNDSPASRFAVLAAESRLRASAAESLASRATSSLHEQPQAKHASMDHNNSHQQQHYYSTSSFEAALNQVLELERDSPGSSSHHQSMESCVRDFFRV